ncbi:MAG TPA: POTRA domain-containing protein [Vicinamibacterales bacterium]|nr:POTRA domain-containing protein [Vicinamibacterales bacterium]
MGVLLALVLAIGQAQPPAVPLSPQASSPAAAYAGRPIVQVEVMVEGRLTIDTLLISLIETPAGSPLSMASVRETIAHLYSLGRFQEIAVDARPLEGGVALTYELVPVHSVQRIEFRGTLGLGRSELRAAVTSRFGTAPPASRAASVAEMLQDYYFDRGYLGAAIRPVVEVVHDPDGTILTFEIAAGARASVRHVTIAGDPGEPRDRFLRTIHADPGRPYERVEVQARLADYLEELRHEGRYEARGSHRITSQSDDGRSVDLAITVERGPEVVVRFEGDTLPKDALEELVPVQREGSVDADILEDSERRIVAYLNQQGYWKASAAAARREINGSVEIVFTVRKGLQYRIGGGPQLSGNVTVPALEIQSALQNLDAGELFVGANLDTAVAAIRGIYLRRGFAQVKVESVANELSPTASGEGRIQPVIVITEGALIRIGEVTFSGNKAITSVELSRLISSAPGQPYYEPQVVQDRESILGEYLNRGFAAASVNVTPAMPDASRVDIRVEITEGPQSLVDHVLILGNVKTDSRVIEREIQLRPGQPLGLEALFETRRRLGALGLFRRIRIREIQHGDTERRDILIEVEEAPSTTIGYGGGLELSERLASGAEGAAEERFELAPRGFFEVGRRNIGGKNRSANLYTRLALRSDSDQGGGEETTFGFAEYRVVGTYREPRTFGWNADVTLTAAIEQGVRSTFKFSRQGLNGEILRRLSPAVRTSARYTFGTTRTFDEVLTEEEQAAIDRIFPQVRLSVFSTTIARDTRDDALDPTQGLFLTAEGSLASRTIGGQVGFIKSYVQAHAYRRLPLGPRVVFAGRIAVGLADGFPREVQVPRGDGSLETQILEDLPASERFFAGGDTTMRGFALDSVGTPETITANGFPRGGNGLVLLNGELRVPVWKDLGAAFFIDAGNVFGRVTQIDPGELRAAVGVGLRYRSPVGPLRFDVGFKLDRRGTVESPRAFHFSFGQAF